MYLPSDRNMATGMAARIAGTSVPAASRAFKAQQGIIRDAHSFSYCDLANSFSLRLRSSASSISAVAKMSAMGLSGRCWGRTTLTR